MHADDCENDNFLFHESRKLLEQCAKLRRQSQAMVDGHGEKQVLSMIDLMEKMQRRWRAASHENAQLREQNGRLKRQIENFETALAEARDENQRLNSQHASDQELIAGLQRELDQYKERFKRARTELQNAAPSLIPSICRQNHHQGGESRKIGQKRRSTSLTSRIPEGKRTKNHHHFDGQQFGDNAEAVENGGGQNQQEKTSAESSIDSTASRVRRRRMFGSNTETEEDIGDGDEAAETQKIGKFHGDPYFPPLNAGNFGRRFGLGPLISLSNSNGGLISQNGGGGRRQQQKIQQKQQQRENKNTLTPLRTAAENDGMLLTLISSSRTGPNSPMQPPAPPPSTTTSVASAFNSHQSPFSRPLLTPFYTSTMASARPSSQRQQPPSRKLLLDPLFVPLGAVVNSNSSNTNPRPAAAAQNSPTSPQSRQILRNNHVTPVSSRPRRIPVRIGGTPMDGSSRRCALN